ncbi:hypothetical protein KR222_004702 [Zaprionus bogoriensis]|nr:hypothetical protein KR222_004702 [Zaprionus bogoriensis]
MLTSCRLCLRQDANFLVTHGQVLTKIVTCTGLDLEPDDGLPQLICDVCRLRLEEFHYFRKRCHAADRRLRYMRRLGGSTECKAFADAHVDAVYLQDVAKCTGAACVESNAQWRREAIKSIRSEMDAYKKELLALCKQQVREEIEQEVRSELEALLLAQARKECRVRVLDDLFYEVENFFIRKRDEAALDQAHGSEGFVSDSEAAELESVSTGIGQQQLALAAVGAGSVLDDTPSTSADGVVLLDETIDENPVQQLLNTTLINEPVCPAPVPTTPVAMVEINMQNTQLSHLRDDAQFTKFLSSCASSSASKPKTPQPKKRGPKPQTAKIKQLCGEHIKLLKRPRKNYVPNSEENCFRCRLRTRLNSSAF